MNVKCEKFREHVKNSMLGFADLLLEPPGIRLHDCQLMCSGDSVWVGLPSRPYEDRKGEKKYARLVDFSTRKAYYEFQEAAREAIREYRERNPKTQSGPDEGVPFI